MVRLWIGLAVLILAQGGALAAGGEQIKWVKLEDALGRAAADGKPAVVFCATDLLTAGPIVKYVDPAFSSEAVRAFRDAFHFVKCTDLKTVKALKAASRCELIVLDPEGSEIHRVVVGSADEIVAALKAALLQYDRKPILWNAEAPPEGSDKPMIVLLFADDSPGAAAAVASLEDRRVARMHGQCVFVRIAYRKDSPEAKEWNIPRAPTLLLLGSGKEFKPKSVLERSSDRKSPREMKAFLAKGLAAIEKERKEVRR